MVGLKTNINFAYGYKNMNGFAFNNFKDLYQCMIDNNINSVKVIQSYWGADTDFGNMSLDDVYYYSKNNC